MLMEQIREVDGLASLTRELENSMKKRKYDENLKDQMNPAAPIHMMSPYYDQSQVYQSYYPSPAPYGYDLGNSMYQQLIYQQMQQYPQYPVMMNPENVKFMQNGMQNIEDIPKKRKRTNYKDPENAAKLNNALNCMMNQNGDDTPKDLKTVSKMFGVPYNTLRDNYLRVTTGQVPTRAKPKNNDDADKKKSLSPSNKNPSPRTSTGGNSVPSSLGAAQYPVCFPAMVPLPIMPAFPQYAAPVASYPMQMISMVPQGQKPGGYPFYQNKDGHYQEPKSSPLLSAKSSGSQNSQSRGSISKNKSKESDDGAASPFASDVSRTPSVDHTSHSENSNDDV